MRLHLAVLAMLAVVGPRAQADSTVAVTTPDTSIRALFALQGTTAIPLVCWDPATQTAVPRFQCSSRIPVGATVRFDNQTVAQVAGPRGASCGGEVDPLPALRLDAVPAGAVYAVYPSTLSVPKPLPTTHVGGDVVYQIPRRFGDSATDEIRSRVRGNQSQVEWRGDGKSAELATQRSRKPTRVYDVPQLDNQLTTELFLYIPSDTEPRKARTTLYRRSGNPRAVWEQVAAWTCD